MKMQQNGRYIAMIEEAASFIESVSGGRPTVGAVLGSGLGAADFSKAGRVREIDFGQVPHLPCPSVEGHAGKLILLDVEGVRCAILSGRVHLYEGWDASMVVFGVRALMRTGCKVFVLTNAAGAINRRLRPGSLVLITDHINLTGQDPTRGPTLLPWGGRFTSMVGAYSPACRRLLKAAAEREGIQLEEGVYAALQGPSYETPAEIRMLKRLGADLVGMSTAVEAIALRHGGALVAGISCVTNLGAGIEGSSPNHEEVKRIATAASEKLARLFVSSVKDLATLAAGGGEERQERQKMRSGRRNDKGQR